MDNKYDKLDDFLRDQLNDSSENPTWNVPGDHVFENAIKAIPGKKRNHRRFWLILPLLFLAVMIGREWMHMNQIKSLENKIANLEESVISNSAGVANTNFQKDDNTKHDADQTNIESFTSDNHQADQRKESNSAIRSSEETTIAESKHSFPESTTAAHSSVKSSAVGIHFNQTDSNEDYQSPVPTLMGQNTSRIQTQGIIPYETLETTLMPEVVRAENATTDEKINWSTSAIAGLSISNMATDDRHIRIDRSVPAVEVTVPSSLSQTLQYGILIGGNSSWLTMQNIPQGGTANLYDYDNHQPGANVYAFIEKPVTKKLTIQAGIGYQYYQNQSTLEDMTLFDEDNVVEMPDGKELYMAPIDVINPLGDLASMVEFRVSDQMHQNDILNQYTQMKQQLHVVHFDLSAAYEVVSVNRFSLSVGAGLGVGYLAGLQNDFNVSCYHNGQLQSSRKEQPKELIDSQKWYGQAIGRLDLAYRLTDRMSLILESQYRGGVSSLRRGTEENGSHTYLHSFGFAAGLKHRF